MKNRQMIGTLLIIIAGCFWGSQGIFVREFASYGFSSIQISTIRLTLAAVIYVLILLIRRRSEFRISLKDIPLLIGMGTGSVLLCTVLYFIAISMMSLSTAAILLYTSPVWIMLMSIVFFREKLTGRKLIALVLAVGGCVLVSGITGGGVTLTGVLVGLGSAIAYALYSILGTLALKKYSPYTITAYAFLFASAGAWAICRPADMLGKIAAAPDLASLLFFCILLAVVTAVVPYLAYTLGLRRIEASKAGIIATIEPMVATLLGVIVYSEPLTILSGLGIALILSAVILLNLK